MPIDLGNLNISIQQFQAVSRGKYNAGDVKLASDHSLERINNHVRMQNLNKVPISHDEVLADLRGIVSLSGSTPADLSNGLANGSLKPLFAVALAKACDDAGLANLPPAEKIARFAPDQPAGAALAQSLGALPPGIPVTPQLLQSLAAGALRQ